MPRAVFDYDKFMIDIIYCAGGNRKLAQIAKDEGFLYGARSDDIRDVHCDGLIDVNWKSYDWKKHLSAIEIHRPKFAVVPDVQRTDCIEMAISQGWEIFEMGTIPIIVPKLFGVTKYIPAEFVIGVSVPSRYSGHLPLIWEIRKRNVHLLGGSPVWQRKLWFEFTAYGVNINSIDINCHNLASNFGSYWDGEKWNDSERETIGKYDAFKKSCQGIKRMWENIARSTEKSRKKVNVAI